MIAELLVLGLLAYATYRFVRGGGSTGVTAWQQAATALDMDLTFDSRRATLRGRFEGARVEATTYQGSDRTKGGVSITVTREDSHHSDVRLTRHPPLRAPGSTVLQLGDRRFDREVYLEGSNVAIAAMLTSAVRKDLRDLMKQAAVVVDRGRLEIDHAGFPSSKRLTELVAAARELFVELFRPDERTAERLLDNAHNDTVEAVRETNLRLLLEVFPHTEPGQRAVQMGLAHPTARIRMLAAAAKPDGAIETLGAMLRDERIEHKERADALPLSNELGEAFHPELKLALTSVEPPLQARIIDHIAGLGARELLPELRQLVPDARSETGPALCRAFVALEDHQAEPQLLQMLDRGDLETQIHAARALAQLGTVRAVQPLMEIASGLMRPTQLKSAARHAVATIQEHLGDADVGDVSLATPAETQGELSLAEQPGELTVIDGDEK